MSEYALTQVSLSDKRMLAQVDALLVENGITRDANLDYICAMVDGENRVIATGSCFGATLRCFAVSQQHQGEGLLNEVVSHLMEYQMARDTPIFSYIPKSNPRSFSRAWAFMKSPGWTVRWCLWKTGETGSRPICLAWKKLPAPAFPVPSL